MHERSHRRPIRPGPPGVSRHQRPEPALGAPPRRRDDARRVGDLLRGAAREQRSVVLPGEDALVDRFRTSRNTVREALALLREDGVLDRRRGVGTVVAPSAPRHDPTKIEGPVYFAADGAARVRYVNLLVASVEPSEELRRRLDVDEEVEVTLLERLTLIDDDVLAFRSAYVPVPLALVLAAEDDLHGDYWDLLEAVTGAELTESASTVSMVRADASVASAMQVDEGSLLALVESTTRDARDRTVSLSFLRVPPPHFQLAYRARRA